MAGTRTGRLSQGLASTSINFQHTQLAAFVHRIYRAERIFLHPPVTNEASSPLPGDFLYSGVEVLKLMGKGEIKTSSYSMEQAQGTKQEGQSC